MRDVVCIRLGAGSRSIETFENWILRGKCIRGLLYHLVFKDRTVYLSKDSANKRSIGIEDAHARCKKDYKPDKDEPKDVGGKEDKDEQLKTRTSRPRILRFLLQGHTERA